MPRESKEVTSSFSRPRGIEFGRKLSHSSMFAAKKVKENSKK
jgi:hypothetical protein